MIDVVVPVLGRPANAAKVAESLEAATSLPHLLTFVCTPGDRLQIAACEATGAHVIVATWPAASGDFARKINLAFRELAEPFLFQAADDVTFHHGWDVAAIGIADDLDAAVIGTNDLGNDAVLAGTHSTHTLIRRDYITDPGAAHGEPGHVFHEGYGHQFVDVELVELAKHRGTWAFAADSIVEHHHPFWKGRRAVPLDATYRKGLASGGRDRALYRQRSQLWTTSPRPAPAKRR